MRERVNERTREEVGCGEVPLKMCIFIYDARSGCLIDILFRWDMTGQICSNEFLPLLFYVQYIP